jgi:hypothetical protein
MALPNVPGRPPLRLMARRLLGQPLRWSPLARTNDPRTILRDAWVPDPLTYRIADIQRIRDWTPTTKIGAIVWESLRYLPSDLAAELVDRFTSVLVMESDLALVKIHGLTGRREDFGVVGCRVITDAGVAFLADDFNDGSTEITSFDFHGLGTGTNAEAAGDTTLQTELTTEYTSNVRATGTPTNPTAPTYRSVGTNTLDSGTPAVTEHGLFSASSAGTLWDRTTFSAINLVGASGDALQSTYTLTITAGT